MVTLETSRVHPRERQEVDDTKGGGNHILGREAGNRITLQPFQTCLHYAVYTLLEVDNDQTLLVQGLLREGHGLYPTVYLPLRTSLLVQYPGELKVNLWEYIGIMRGLWPKAPGPSWRDPKP